MNIFVLDRDPVICAEYHVDRHVVKMILESAQMLSTTHHHFNSDYVEMVYRKTHMNHPCNVWVRESAANYDWLYSLFAALSQEYTYRYGKTHKSWMERSVALYNNPVPVDKGLTPFALAMPDHFKGDDPVGSYRHYYRVDKAHLAAWKKRDIPYWWYEGE